MAKKWYNNWISKVVPKEWQGKAASRTEGEGDSVRDGDSETG